MKHLFTLLLLSTCTLSAQTYVSVTQQETTSRTTLAARLFRLVPYDAVSYKITYNTTDVFGQPTVASGLFCLPADTTNTYPMAVYNHGTVADREAVPSRLNTGERIIAQGMAGLGMITVAPDYLGLGDNPGIHPYVHADSEASAGRDMLLAVRQWLDEEGIFYNDNLFLTGYSQGGHSTQALHRDLQLNPGDDNLTVTAASHLSGPYSISDVMREAIFSPNPGTLPGYLIYTYISYDYVYDLYDDFNEIFVDEYAQIIDSLVGEQLNLLEFNDRLEEEIAENNASLADLFQDSIRQQLLTRDTTAPIIQAMIDNDTYDWAPDAPTLIAYCTLDEQVPFRNALLADSVMRANGSTLITLSNLGATNHTTCAPFALNATLNLFLPLLDIQPVSVGAVVSDPSITIYPNPAAAGSVLRVEGLPATPSAYLLYDQQGRVIAVGRTDASGNIQLPGRMASGLQVLRVNTGRGQSVVRRFVVR